MKRNKDKFIEENKELLEALEKEDEKKALAVGKENLKKAILKIKEKELAKGNKVFYPSDILDRVEGVSYDDVVEVIEELKKEGKIFDDDRLEKIGYELNPDEQRPKYPKHFEIVEINKRLCETIKVKKADKHGILSYRNIHTSLDFCKEKEGNIYDKAVYLLKGLVRLHPFESLNRTTAFIVVKKFILDNGQNFGVENDVKQAEFLKGIREDKHTDEEIKNWLKVPKQFDEVDGLISGHEELIEAIARLGRKKC